jgi:pimeloyl-ACP methyl ester carboxylesterase
MAATVDVEKEIREASLMENAHRAISVLIRPPRAQYDLADLTSIPLAGDQPPIPRIPIAFKNRRNQMLIGSFYTSRSFDTEPRHCCVVYLHGNIGSQKEGRFLVPYVAPRGISVYCFDFSGSGLSGGDFVSLGHFEHQDVLDSLAFLNRQFKVTEFVLWGRSMGAAAAIVAAPQHPMIKGIIVDSAYASLSKLFSDIASKTPLPAVIRPVAVWWIKREVLTRANFDCGAVRPCREGRQSTVPLMLAHCIDDAFVPYNHGTKIFAEYACADKEMMTLEGGHNGIRDSGWIMKSLRFILRVFRMNFQYVEVAVTAENIEHVASFAELMGNA